MRPHDLPSRRPGLAADGLPAGTPDSRAEAAGADPRYAVNEAPQPRLAEESAFATLTRFLERLRGLSAAPAAGDEARVQVGRAERIHAHPACQRLDAGASCGLLPMNCHNCRQDPRRSRRRKDPDSSK
jgi:hypothetical protein